MNLRPVTVKRIDWFRVLVDLRSAGMSLRVITALTGMSKSTLLDLRNQEADPKTHAGEILVTLWARTTGRPAADVPRWGNEFSAMKKSYEQAWERGSIHCPLCGTPHHTRPPKKGKEKPAKRKAEEEQMPLSI